MKAKGIIKKKCEKAPYSIKRRLTFDGCPFMLVDPPLDVWTVIIMVMILRFIGQPLCRWCRAPVVYYDPCALARTPEYGPNLMGTVLHGRTGTCTEKSRESYAFEHLKNYPKNVEHLRSNTTGSKKQIPFKYQIQKHRDLQLFSVCHLEDLHENFPGDPSIQHGQVLQRPEHVSQLDHDVGQLTVPILSIYHGLKTKNKEWRDWQEGVL